MTIHVKPHLEAVLQAQVAAGNYSSVEDALESAILALQDAACGDNDDLDEEDLAWMKPYIDEAEADVAAHGSLSEDEVWSRLKKRLTGQ